MTTRPPHRRLDRLTPDQQSVVTHLGANLCVTSGAGCGKTRVLVERYIHLLEQDPKLRLQELAAITFTAAAAAEMRGRIRQACLDQVAEARQAGDTRLRDAWQERYWDVDIAPIDTIHGFAQGLLRRYPIEARVDPNFTLLDEAEGAFLCEDVVAATVERLLGEKDADLLAVLEHYGLAEARDMLAHFAGEEREVLQRVAAPALARSDEEILADLKTAVEAAAAEAIGRCTASENFRRAVAVIRDTRGKAEDRREQMRAEALGAITRLLAPRTTAIAQEAATWLADNITLRGGSAKQWPSKEAFDAAKDALTAVRESLRDATKSLPVFDADAERRHLAVARALYRTAGRTIDAYAAAKRERSALDFEDLQIRARDLLRSDPAVLQECRNRYRSLLVDELQDTNFLQFELVELLASAPAARNQAALRPGAFFGVGDPKQSIYRFRGAEVKVFQRAMERVTPAGQKSLHQSFRLHTGTADLINLVFDGLMGGQYEQIEGMRPPKNPAVGEILHVVDPAGEGFPADEGYPHQAAALAARVRELIDGKLLAVWDEAAGLHRPACWGDVAILFRRMTNVHIYEEALERQAVPYYVVAGSGFYKQQETLDCLALLHVLDDPADDLHLAGVLRSPLFAVSDEGLFRLRAAAPSLHEALRAMGPAEVPGTPKNSVISSEMENAVIPSAIENAVIPSERSESRNLAVSDTATSFAAEDRRGIARAAAVLPQWFAAKDRLGLAALIEHVLFDSGYAASAVGRFGGARAYANLRQMVELARRFERQGLHSLGDFIDYITDFLQSEMREEQAPIEAPGADTVRLMTIHKAKGLEFPIVVLPDMAYRPTGSRTRTFIHGPTGLAVRLRDDDSDASEDEPRRPQADHPPSAALALAKLDDAAAQREENHRLFYVAMTRARDYLLFASHEAKIRTNSPSWLDELAAALGADLAPGQRTAALAAGQHLLINCRPPAPEKAHGGPRRGGPRDMFAAGRVAWDRLHDRGQQARPGAVAAALALASPPELPDRPPSEITATALATYVRCPRLYWWTAVLHVDQPQSAAVRDGLTSSQWGSLAHRALELAASPEEHAVETAVDGALREAAAVTPAHRQVLRGRLMQALTDFWTSPLGRRVAAASEALRELPLLLALGASRVRGTMDLVFAGPDGAWELVDYKSSGLDPAGAAAAAGRYDIQLGLYAMAAEAWLGRPIARATVAFLGSGSVVERLLGPDDLRNIRETVTDALTRIAARRYDLPDRQECDTCPFAALCHNGSL